MKSRQISASEIGTYTFCARAWALEKRGYRSNNKAAMDAGTAHHRAVGQREELIRGLTVLLILVLLSLLVLVVNYLLK